MQIVEAPNENVVVTNVALASLRTAVVQQEQFSKLLAEAAKHREDDLGQQPKADQEQVKAGRTDIDPVKKPVAASALASASQPVQPAVDDKRGGAVDIKA